MEMDAGIGVPLIEKAREADREDRVLAEWTALLPWMQTGHIRLIQWPEYRDQRTGANVDQRPAAEIIADLEKAHGRRLV